ncbi:hypothetical protein RI367_004962 [Sorochytrium milnesiophthora]
MGNTIALPGSESLQNSQPDTLYPVPHTDALPAPLPGSNDVGDVITHYAPLDDMHHYDQDQQGWQQHDQAMQQDHHHHHHHHDALSDTPPPPQHWPQHQPADALHGPSQSSLDHTATHLQPAWDNLATTTQHLHHHDQWVHQHHMSSAAAHLAHALPVA